MVIVGSTALAYHNLFVDEKPRDLDVWIAIGERHDQWEVPTGAVVDYMFVPQEVLDLLDVTEGHCSPADILTIKMSHLQWDIKWQKTLRHILWLQDLGYEYKPELFDVLTNWHIEVHGNKAHLSLDKTAEQFFDNAVPLVVEHDTLHKYVAGYDAPVYTTVLAKGQDVLVDHKKFLELSHEQQIRMWREEITVIAIERWMLGKKKVTEFEAYQRALKKTLCDLSKGWASVFIVKNIRELRQIDYHLFKNAQYHLEEKGIKISSDDGYEYEVITTILDDLDLFPSLITNYVLLLEQMATGCNDLKFQDGAVNTQSVISERQNYMQARGYKLVETNNDNWWTSVIIEFDGLFYKILFIKEHIGYEISRVERVEQTVIKFERT